MADLKAYKANLVFTKDTSGFTCLAHGYVSVCDGRITEVSQMPPESAEVEDFGDRLLIPSFVDLHLHAPQFENLGLGLDCELLPWLSTYTFPEERKFADPAYARAVYTRFADTLVKYGTTRAVVFATVHTAATEILCEILEARGLGAFVGRVNMDRNAEGLAEDTSASLRETEAFIERRRSSARVKPILTPRFTPSCSDELMRGLGAFAAKYAVPVQSHLSESRAEVEWVKNLAPDAAHYVDTYDRFGLFGETPTVMAHCVYLNPPEIALMREKGVFVAHCPASNLNISSGIAPVRQLLTQGVHVGLGTDISGGHSVSMASAIVLAIQSSKAYRVLADAESAPLTLAEAFFLATKAGGRFFGKVGSFEAGYDFDALVVDDAALAGENPRSLEERVARFLYAGDHTQIVRRFAFGEEL